MVRLQERIQWLDLVRALGISGVVLCHATENIYSLTLDGMAALRLPSQAAVLGAFTAGRLGVPLFLMISGYLLLDRRYDEEGCRRFWKKNWLHLLICTEIWFVVYDVFLRLCGHGEISWKLVLKHMLFLRKVELSHVWYMPMILGFYLLIPFAANALQSVKPGSLKLPVLLFSAYAFCYPVLSVINTALGGGSISLLLSMGFSGGAYGLYFVFGYLTKRGAFKGLKSWILLLTAAVSYLCTVGLQLFAYRNGYAYNVWYDCLFLMLCALSLFELFSRLRQVKGYRAVRFVSRYSFGVYLIHNLVLTLLLPHVKVLGGCGMVKNAVLWLASLAAGIVCAALIARLPKAGRFLLYAK